MPAALTDSSQIICEVWASNVEEEMRKIRQIIQSYNYIAMVSSLGLCVCVRGCRKSGAFSKNPPLVAVAAKPCLL